MPSTLQSSMARNAWFAAAFESLPVAAMIIDKAAHIDTVNERACVLLGVPCVSIKGKHLNEVLGVWDAKQDGLQRLPLEQVFQLGLSLAADDVALMGQTIHKCGQFSVVIVPMTDDERQLLGAVVTLSLTQKAVRPSTTAVETAASEQAPQHKQSLYVRSSGRYVRILFSELLWVEAMENYVLLHTTREKIVVHATLKSMDDALANNGFQRIHRSFIVKKDEIERIEENHVIVNGSSLPIGKSFRAELLESLTLI